MMHDCALTKNYMLLVDVPLVFDAKVPACLPPGPLGSQPVVLTAQDGRKMDGDEAAQVHAVAALPGSDLQLLAAPWLFQVMIKENKLPFVLKDRPMRIGVVPRAATSADEIRWFASEPVMCFHTCNGAGLPRRGAAPCCSGQGGCRVHCRTSPLQAHIAPSCPLMLRTCTAESPFQPSDGTRATP